MIKLGLRGWKFVKEEKAPTEDVTYSRNILEKIASLPIDHQFAINTREGTKIFKCVTIQKPSEVKIKDK